MIEETKQIILALETAIMGGSVSVLKDGIEIAAVCGDHGISRAEDLILSVDQILNDAQIDPAEIGTIAVSNGPGSYTGIRIGISTAMGLAESAGARLIGVDVFDAMKLGATGRSHVITAVPIGREDVAWKEFLPSEVADTPKKPEIGSFEEFASILRETRCNMAILHESLTETIDAERPEFPEALEITNAGINLARYIGLAAFSNRGSSDIEPIYLLNQSRTRGLF